METERERYRYIDRWERTVDGECSNCFTIRRTTSLRNRHNEVASGLTLEFRATLDCETAFCSEEAPGYVDRWEQTIIGCDEESARSRRVLNVKGSTSLSELSTNINRSISIQNGHQIIPSLDVLCCGDVNTTCIAQLRELSDLVDSRKTRKTTSCVKNKGTGEGTHKTTGSCLGEAIGRIESRYMSDSMGTQSTELPHTDRWERTEVVPDVYLIYRMISSGEHSSAPDAVSCVLKDKRTIHDLKHQTENESTSNAVIKIAQTVERYEKVDNVGRNCQLSGVNRVRANGSRGDLCNIEENLTKPSVSKLCLWTDGAKEPELNIALGATIGLDTVRISGDTECGKDKYFVDEKTLLEPHTMSDLGLRETIRLPCTDRWERTVAVERVTVKPSVLVDVPPLSHVSDAFSIIDGDMREPRHEEMAGNHDSLVQKNDSCRHGLSRLAVSSRVLEERKTVRLDQAATRIRHMSYLNLSTPNRDHPGLISQRLQGSMLCSATREIDNLTGELVTALQHAKTPTVPALLMRVILVALPIYLLFLLFFLLFCVIPVCEDEYQCMFSNHLRHSMSPMLQYTDGAPPT